tara:strand:+ start:328 stop:654 length:327 start_codon:yes stop_codon:yes gene_type:complete
MKLLNKSIYAILLGTIIIVFMSPWGVNEIKAEDETLEKMWAPTVEDIAYQDSMYQIIQNTQNDISYIKKDIVHILERLYYKDGTWDSIRYVKGGAIDRRINNILEKNL